jgi:DNA polymerase-3 subunit gamma/tau
VAAKSEATKPVAIAAPLVLEQLDNAMWIERFADFGIGGVLGNIAANCCLDARSDTHLLFTLDRQHASFFDTAHTQRLTEQFSRVFAQSIRIEITVGDPQIETPAAYRERLRQQRLAHARQLIHDDPNVQMLQETFGATIDENSIEPLEDH